jgi:hypothetical protein
MVYSEETRQRLFRSARGLTCLFWTALAAFAGNWAVDAARLRGGAMVAVGMLFAIPLLTGLWLLGGAMAGMRRSGGYGAFWALSLALLGLSPFGAFWRMHPDVVYFSWNAAALWAAWLAWLSAACWLARRYARDLGDKSLAFEAALAGAMVPAFGVGVAVLLGVAMARAGNAWTPQTLLLALGTMTEHSRLVAGFPFLVTAYTLWLAKESGYRRLMGE